jgi:hypothetical protein
MVLSTQSESMKGLSTPKIPKVLTPLNVIAIERECDSIIGVQYNGLVLHGMLVDGGVGINVMTIFAMKYLRLKINRPTSITLKLANKQVVRP